MRSKAASTPRAGMSSRAGTPARHPDDGVVGRLLTGTRAVVALVVGTSVLDGWVGVTLDPAYASRPVPVAVLVVPAGPTRANGWVTRNHRPAATRRATSPYRNTCETRIGTVDDPARAAAVRDGDRPVVVGQALTA
jgi:hypothetical protein